MSINQTATPSAFMVLPDKAALVAEFVGKPLSSLRTPAAIIDLATFKRNAQAMKDRCESIGALFRAHIKSHKTVEGTILQLATNPPTDTVIVSTLPEAWGLVNAGLTDSGQIKDILYSFPLPLDRIEDIMQLQSRVERMTIMIDNIYQVSGIAAYVEKTGNPVNLRVFLKLDQGGARAGLDSHSPDLPELISAVLNSPYLTLHGLYTHAGNAYAARDGDSAADYLKLELKSVAECALSIHMLLKMNNRPPPQLVLSVGSTPTAHASTLLASSEESGLGVEGKLSVPGGTLEVHAGVYPLCDLQQKATGLATEENIALGILARVCSVYSLRDIPQVLVDAGALAFSKDTGPSGDYGRVYVNTAKVALADKDADGKGDSSSFLEGWRLTKISQEHGVLSPPEGADIETTREQLRKHQGSLINSVITIRPQHACLTLAGHPWYYIIDSPEDDVVRDVWVPWKGW